jgi:hypothetical protein
LFIAAEYYKNSTKANPNHITKVGELVEGGKCLKIPYFHSFSDFVFTEGYKLKVDSRLQYGQKNAQGELRFLVFHDEERKPYQVNLFLNWLDDEAKVVVAIFSIASWRLRSLLPPQAKLLRWLRLSASKPWETRPPIS